MNLKNNRITLGELLDNPASHAVLQRRFPTLLRHPMLNMARKAPLEQAVAFARNRLSPQDINCTLEELRRL